MLNKAYKVLMAEDQRRKYDQSIGQMRLRFGENSSPLGYSTWKGPLRPQALFVDEIACIGDQITILNKLLSLYHHLMNAN